MTTIYELKIVAKLISEYAFIAGGFYKDIKSWKEPKDIDVFMRTQKGFNEVVKILEKYEQATKVENKISTTVGRFEVIRPLTVFRRRLWGEPEMVASSFDISIAQVYIDEEGLHLIDEDIDEDISNKKFKAFVYKGDEQRTADRIKRYNDYGYKCYEENEQEVSLYEFFSRDSRFKSKKKKHSHRTKIMSTGGY